MAPDYITYMIGRALIGAVIGGFWSLSAAIAMRLVPSDQVSRAFAIFNGGNALAMVVAAPLGAYLGTVIGWRGAFFCMVPVSVLAFIWLLISLPSMPVAHRNGGSKQPFAVIALLARRDVRIGMLAVGCFFMGQFTLFTYLRPFLETVTGMSVRGLSLVLLMIGVAGFLGTTVINRALTRGFYRTLGGIPLVMAALAAGLIAFSGTVGMVVALLAIWGFLATAAPVGWWAWVPKTFPKDAEAGGGLMVAVVQLSIGLGSTIGGVLVDLDGYSSAFLASSALLVLAVLLTVATARRAAA
jgi:predicted MFS family arabinose efflux permease